MPETLMPLLTGLFLVFAGMLIGYFLWYRDRSQDEANRLRMENENDCLTDSLRKQKADFKTMSGELVSQHEQMHVLRELCDNLENGRENYQLEQSGLESDINGKLSCIEELQTHLAEEKRLRISLEDQLQLEQHQLFETLGIKEEQWSDQNSKLQTELLHRTTDIKQLTSACARTTENLHRAEATIAELKSDLSTQQSLLDTTRLGENGLEKERGTLEQALEDSKQRLQQTVAERDKALAAEQEAHDSTAALHTRIQNQELTIRQSREKSDGQANKIREENELRLEIESSSQDIQHQMKIEIQELQQQAELSQREVGDLVAKLESLEQTNLKGTSLLEDRLAEIALLKRGREKLATQIATMEQHQNIVEARFEKRLADLRLTQVQRDELATRLVALQEDPARGKSSIERRIAELQTVRNDRDDLAVRLARIEMVRVDSSTSSLRIREEAQTRIDILISQRDKAFTDLEALRCEIEALKQVQTNPVILAGRFGEEIDEEYGGRTRRHETRGVIYFEVPERCDDLKRISGIAEVFEQRLNEYGIYTFKQIMQWEEHTVREFCTLLAFKDRIDRDDWIGQARKLYRQKQREKNAA